MPPSARERNVQLVSLRIVPGATNAPTWNRGPASSAAAAPMPSVLMASARLSHSLMYSWTFQVDSFRSTGNAAVHVLAGEAVSAKMQRQDVQPSNSLPISKAYKLEFSLLNISTASDMVSEFPDSPELKVSPTVY